MQKIGSSVDKAHVWNLGFDERTFLQAKAWLGNCKDWVIIYLNMVILYTHFFSLPGILCFPERSVIGWKTSLLAYTTLLTQKKDDQNMLILANYYYV